MATLNMAAPEEVVLGETVLGGAVLKEGEAAPIGSAICFAASVQTIARSEAIGLSSYQSTMRTSRMVPLRMLPLRMVPLSPTIEPARDML